MEKLVKWKNWLKKKMEIMVKQKMVKQKNWLNGKIG